jgi:uncharacterized protein (UPF0276 family)
LYGHGVHLSPTTARADDAAAHWFAAAATETTTRRYRHVTEHWGFSRAHDFARGAPLPLPASESVVACATRSLRALHHATRVPVGFENLALAFSDDDVDAQPAMLTRVLEAVDGLLLLDVHNLWCQAVNFERDPQALAARYPLARVRQLHVAGGSWSTSALDGRPFRRDTHDALVPDEVMELVSWLVPRCPALECVILERLPGTVPDAHTRDAWRAEWTALAKIVRAAAVAPPIVVADARAIALESQATVEQLARYQDALLSALATQPTPAAVRDALLGDQALPFRDQIARFELRCLEVAMLLVAKWGVLAG